MKTLLERADDLTAVLSSDDDLAFGALKAAAEAGVDVPNELSIVGYDDYETSKYTIPSLTTVRHPIEEVVRLAVESIGNFIANPHSTETIREVLSTELVPRDSHAAPRRETKLFGDANNG
jgi:LacI family transcriptional regulator